MEKIYVCLKNPPVPGLIPDKELYTVDKEYWINNEHVYGFCVYEKRLTPDDCERYSLAELKSDGSLDYFNYKFDKLLENIEDNIIECGRDLFYARVMKQMEKRV